MAYIESEREDLMEEATALVRRMELRLAHYHEPVVIGQRREKTLSIYFGQDLVYHFDATHRLRRAFVDGLLFRTQGTTLSQLQRKRKPGVSALMRTNLSDDECTAFLQTMDEQLVRLRNALETDDFQVLRKIPEVDNLEIDLPQILTEILRAQPRLAPAIKGKR